MTKLNQSLGNHEFDENVKGLVPFLNEVNFPVLATNLDVRKEPELAKAKNFYNSTILDVRGVKVGVVGYLTPETKVLTVPNEVEFLDEIETIKYECKALTLWSKYILTFYLNKLIVKKLHESRNKV